MGVYITKSDIENVFGKDNVSRWSNLDGTADADEARITIAIAIAEEDVESRFRNGRYSLPFSPISKIVVNWCARLAGIWLFENRPSYNKSDTQKEGFQDLKDVIDTEIEMYTSGQRQLLCSLVTNIHETGPVAI